MPTQSHSYVHHNYSHNLCALFRGSLSIMLDIIMVFYRQTPMDELYTLSFKCTYKYKNLGAHGAPDRSRKWLYLHPAGPCDIDWKEG